MKTPSPRNRHVGSSLESFLEEDGVLGEVDSVAQKRVIAWQLAEVMKARDITKALLAKRMGTSRAAVDRLLDPENASVTLVTLSRSAAVVGADLRISIEPHRQPRQARPRGQATSEPTSKPG
jgi:antitoxin HicB